MKGNRRDEESNIGILDELIMYDDHIVRGNDSYDQTIRFTLKK